MTRASLLSACLLLAHCSPTPVSPPNGNATTTPAAMASPEPSPGASATTLSTCLPGLPGAFVPCQFLGRWRGVEGMVLVVSKARRDGGYRLEMQWDLDHHGTFTAAPVGEPAAPGLVFTRDGKQLTLRRTDGDATGLKYLAGKKDCLTVAPGEGYCRD